LGLFTALITLPLAPVRGVAWIAEHVAEEAERQCYDEGRIRGELLALELEAEDGKLSERERCAREAELLERLAVAQTWTDTRGPKLREETVDG
jgi:hypothetical protein